MTPGSPRTPVPVLRCGRHRLVLDRPLVMGIVNVTPDSFSGDGTGDDVARAVARVRRQIADGADLIDIGGESTRPGATPVSEAEELRRVVPVIEALADVTVPLSIDSSKPAVMRAAVRAGASMINDVDALRAPQAMAVAAATDAAVCLMHRPDTPLPPDEPRDGEATVAAVETFLLARVVACLQAGIDRDRIVIDPGFGFGKRARDNLALLRAIGRLAAHGHPLLVGLSRKGVLGSRLDRRADSPLPSSLAEALVAVARGASIVRVHDVAATRDALAVWSLAGLPD